MNKLNDIDFVDEFIDHDIITYKKYVRYTDLIRIFGIDDVCSSFELDGVFDARDLFKEAKKKDEKYSLKDSRKVLYVKENNLSFDFLFFCLVDMLKNVNKFRIYTLGD